MCRKLCVVLALVLVTGGSAAASFNTVGVYDPTDGPYNNDIEQSAVFKEGMDSAYVIDLQSFRDLLARAYPTDAGGVVNAEPPGDLEADGSIVAKYGENFSKSLQLLPHPGKAYSTGGTGSGERQPISGETRFSYVDQHPVVNIGELSGDPGEVVTAFAMTVVDRDRPSCTPGGCETFATATFSGGGTITSVAIMFDGTVSNDQDTFFGFVAPLGQSITRVEITMPQWSYYDDFAFITSALKSDVPEVAWEPDPPAHAKADIDAVQALTWSAGQGAVQHDIYFGTSASAVEGADTNTVEQPGKTYYWRVDEVLPDGTVNEGVMQNFTVSTAETYRGRQEAGNETYELTELELSKTYYWRVDEVLADGTVNKGVVWNFTVNEFLSVDNMESYGENDTPGQADSRIWYTWRDGYGWIDPTPANAGNGTGSYVDSNDAVVNTGTQSMRLDYNNSGTLTDAVGNLITNMYSEVSINVAELGVGTDWARKGMTTLDLMYIGSGINDAEPMYVAVGDGTNTAVISGNVADQTKTPRWTVWRIALQDFVTAGNVNLQNVTELAIGVGTRGNATIPGGAGIVYIDDIALFPPRCFNPDVVDLQGDLNGDCVVDFADFAILVEGWLNSGLSAMP
jgi:hypothetical protein